MRVRYICKDKQQTSSSSISSSSIVAPEISPDNLLIFVQGIHIAAYLTFVRLLRTTIPLTKHKL